MSRIPLSSYLDVTILNPDLTDQEVKEALHLCIPFKPCTFCVRPSDIPLVKPVCQEHRIGLCVVLGFPHGCQLTSSKADEAERYLEIGVDEIDMVCNIGWVRSGKWDLVLKDIAAVSAFTRPAGVPLKVIFETCLLTEEEIRKLVDVSVDAGADFVKTSTGFNGDGDHEAQVKLLLKMARKRIQVKPSGDILTREQAHQLIRLGATRLDVLYHRVPDLCEDELRAEKKTNSSRALSA
ncbi:MAG: deoxyribose-phosphate aldolase [Kiritimatiellia bacterium]